MEKDSKVLTAPSIPVIVLAILVAILLLAGCSSGNFVKTDKGDKYDISTMNSCLVASGSMEPTLMTGETAYADPCGAKSGRSGTYEGFNKTVAAGDIVIFNDPAMSSRTLIKRVVATAGQTVDIANNKLVVDGMPLDESYTNGSVTLPLSHTLESASIEYPYTVPEGCVWVMGDNRTNSQDSRYFGAVKISTIGGIVRMVESNGKYYSIQ